LRNIEEDEDNDNDKFDFIFANNILEHMQSPHNFLLHIKKYLKEGGLAIVGVPCIPYLTPFLRFNKFKGALASLHINFFTRSTLIKTLEFAGWSVLEARGFRFSNSVVDYIFNLIYPHFYIVARINTNFK